MCEKSWTHGVRVNHHYPGFIGTHVVGLFSGSFRLPHIWSHSAVTIHPGRVRHGAGCQFCWALQKVTQYVIGKAQLFPLDL
jgi:hypothetical protein